jgi:predicted AAA+ superfamily ATPase
MIDLELLPFSLSEAHGAPLFDTKRLLQNKSPLGQLSKNPYGGSEKLRLLEEYLKKGGLPGICFLRTESLVTRKFRSHIKTILDRDLRQVTRTSLEYLSLKTFLEEIALQQGEVFDLTKACRGARISPNSGKKILSGLESVFLIRTLRKEGDTQGRMVYLVDQGMATFLLKKRGVVLKTLLELRVADWNRFLFSQLYAQLNYPLDSAFELYLPYAGRRND